KLVEVGFGFKAFGQFSRKGFKFLFVHRLPVSVVGVNISKTGNYTILITVSSPARIARYYACRATASLSACCYVIPSPCPFWSDTLPH
ncbi:TPA: hypothetical protein ACXE89_005071, partial [Pluralibacter gergoviae]